MALLPRLDLSSNGSGEIIKVYETDSRNVARGRCAGAVARRVLGSTVIGGMLAASGIAIFLIPVTFYIMERLFSGRKTAPPQEVAERSLDPAISV